MQRLFLNRFNRLCSLSLNGCDQVRDLNVRPVTKVIQNCVNQIGRDVHNYSGYFLNGEN